MHDYIHNLWGAAVCYDDTEDISQHIEHVKSLIETNIKPLVSQIEEAQSNSPWSNIVNGYSLTSSKLALSHYRDLDFKKEGKPMKENTYTISYKQKMKDDWVLVTKTGRSDSEEAKDIMRDLLQGDIPEDHLEVLMWSADVNKNVGNLLEKMERKDYE